VRAGSNCCVTFGRKHERSHRFAVLCWMSMIVLIAAWSLLVLYWRPGRYCEEKS
jgi:hypothetical protein